MIPVVCLYQTNYKVLLLKPSGHCGLQVTGCACKALVVCSIFFSCFLNACLKFCSVIQVMPIITVLCLRSPDNASRAIEAGAGDLAIQAMQKFPSAPLLQRNSCFMIRNLVVRNPENRQVIFPRTNNV